MHNINQYIQEKLVINKNTKLPTTIDITNKEMLMNILTGEFIALYKQCNDHHYTQNVFKVFGVFNYKIQKSVVDYENIINFINEYYNYNFSIDEVKDKKSNLYKILHKFLDDLDKLINMKKIFIPLIGEIVDGHKLYCKWVEYRDK